ncbi:LRR receptor-like serine/threonine-protein kinase EFR [Cryptomeria japonica]|uniref:LRR receptor-like serine/threonine-protein kinase EFR n=1 Tax=Cryptomeria japonica TaxID=3369 RepID=UPI0027DA8827|nr:LRR receptor-like serine/threonine-protein kinase EFR [Cryptomeria japonica]
MEGLNAQDMQKEEQEDKSGKISDCVGDNATIKGFYETIGMTVKDIGSLKKDIMFVKRATVGKKPLMENVEELVVAINNAEAIESMVRVVSLNLTSMGLFGPISPFLGNLSFLRVLDLQNNSFQGHIPYQLGRLFRLKRLRLSGNQLSGSIPPEFSLLSNLEAIGLTGNKLTGIIPPFLGNVSFLKILDLSVNKLEGDIPAQLGMLSQLNWLNLGINNLIGSIPIALSNCTRLQTLELCGNNLNGPIPLEFGRLSELQQVLLWQNQLTGEIPRSVGNWTQLEVLDLELNQLSGTVPLEFGKMKGLRRFSLWENQFVSRSIGRLPNSLSYLGLASNKIGGNIPDEIGNLTNLSLLSLEENRINGTIPSALGKLSNLERLYLEANNLQGRIPESFGQSKRLGLLSLSENMLSGKIPDGLDNLPQLRMLDLHHNHLTGEMPASLGRCQTLEMVDFAHNKLTGNIPPEVAGLQNLQAYLNISNNFLQGSILEMSKMVMVLAIDVSQNNFSGAIPSALASCKGLEYLNLSWNAFEGPIPTSLVDLPNLQYMDLSHNNLSGMIPTTFKKDENATASQSLFKQANGSYRRSNTSALKVWPPKISYEELVDATVLKLQDEHVHQSFSRECNVLKTVRHRNVIRIISACSKLDFKALILPFMSNGSLDRWLYHPEDGRCRLNLSDRIRIAIEIAEGMTYLHHYCFVQVIHCDLKPNNVLLGDDMTSYIADFGLSNIIFGNSMDSLTSIDALKGSIGYIAPEYGIGGKLTTKGDVYSYGILILELLTRKRPTDDMFTEGINLQKWIEMHFPDRIFDVVDNCFLLDAYELETSIVTECLTQLIQIGLFCTRESPQERPNMTDIVDRLNTIRGVFLGTPITPQLPIDISSPFLDNTRGINVSGVGNNEDSLTSTS